MAHYVNVINCTLGGTYFVEGRARVLKTIDGDTKLVDFEDGYGPVERFVDPQAQDEDVAEYVSELNTNLVAAHNSGM